MGRGVLSDAEWERLRPFLSVSNNRCGRWRDHWQVVDGILRRVRTGVQWRDLPERGRRPLAVLITPGQAGDGPHMIPVLNRIRVPRPAGGHPRARPDHLSGDKAYGPSQPPLLATSADQTHHSRAP